MSTKVTRINEIAIEKPNEVFTSIYHLINFAQNFLCLFHEGTAPLFFIVGFFGSVRRYH